MTGTASWEVAMEETYRIHVSGHLADRWADWLGGFELRRQDDGTTELVGPVADQAALHGVIARIRDFGLPLLSVTRVAGPDDAPKQTSTSIDSTPAGGGCP
jgi:hypothetical protein